MEGKEECCAFYDKYYSSLFDALKYDGEWLGPALYNIVGADDTTMSDPNPKKVANTFLTRVRKKLERGTRPKRVIRRLTKEIGSRSTRTSTKDIIRNMKRDYKVGRVYEVNLCEVDLGLLSRKLFSVAPDWMHLGDQLRVPIGMQKVFKGRCKDSCECLREVLIYWLENNLYPTWNDLIQALQRETIGKTVLANELINEYCPGAGYSGYSEIELDSDSDSDGEPKNGNDEVVSASRRCDLRSHQSRSQQRVSHQSNPQQPSSQQAITGDTRGDTTVDCGIDSTSIHQILKNDLAKIKDDVQAMSQHLQSHFSHSHDHQSTQ